MGNKSKDTIKNFVNSSNIDDSSSDTFFCENNPSKIFLNKSQERVAEVNLLIDLIRKHSPISIWKLTELVSMSHSKLYYLLRDLEFAGVVFSKIRLNENNRSERVIYIKREVKKDG